ncbi:hypothetical protein RVR_6776 [Actinacidiphila reveromycinica]|uniref:Secreted protein n=1 Tax=Actinacidiphila reveromycinica TaxID=659352 RepID=A0A7U3UWG8_9ACTN|nr:hypothetical protein [Streptomyces sp. SN-593]BBA99936.1 hypothetical protein RVR_6776 [Streptomyces sp. SN-593]
MRLARTRDRSTARRLALTAAVLGLAVAVPAATARADTAHGAHRVLPVPPAGAAHTAHADHTTGAGTPQAATPRPATPQPVRSGDPQSTVDRVADFYSAYVDVVWDARNDDLRNGLRQHYLTAGFQKDLSTWEAAQHADGVLRAQDNPVGWQVTPDGSGAGHAFSVVRLSWGDPADPDYTYLKVQSDLDTKLISDIEEA